MASDRPVALVTGASSGFGRLTATELVRRGYRVFGAFRGSDGGFDHQASELASEGLAAGLPIESVQMDVRDDLAVESGVGEVLERGRRIDALINCAGYGVMGPFESTTVDQIRHLYETNVFGMMRVTHAVLPVMREQESGSILNFSSDVGLRANFFQTGYASSKYAVEGFTLSLSLELQQFGIRVAMINPGWYETEFGDSVVSTFGEGPAAAAYEGLVRARNAGVDNVEGPSDRPEEVALLVGDILDSGEHRFHNPAGWNPVRMAGVVGDEVDVYQRRLFEYYGLEAFRLQGRSESDEVR